LEAQDVLAVLRNAPDAPRDLAQRALLLAGELLELVGHSPLGQGYATAMEILQSGRALTRFYAICEAQGGFTEPGTALWKHEIRSLYSGTVTEIENRKLAKIAKLAGAPEDALAGILFQAPIGRHVAVGDVLYTIYSSAQGQLAYALEYVHQENGTIIHIEEI
jgi:thymidine phosphorylase